MSRQIEICGPYAHGHYDAEMGLPLDTDRYRDAAEQREYANGHRAAYRDADRYGGDA